MLSEKIKKSMPRIRELFAYAAGCGFSLGLKVLLAMLINYAGVVFSLAYLMTHGIILFTSFFYHHCITFRKKFTTFSQACRDFADFAAMVILLNALDYILVVTGEKIMMRSLLPADCSDLTRQFFRSCLIIGISGFIFVLRYFVYKRLFKRSDGTLSPWERIKNLFRRGK